MMRRLTSILSLIFATMLLLIRCSPAPSAKPSPENPTDRTGAAPRTADGKPDLSGVWEMKKDRPCPPEGCADNQVVNQFFDIGAGLPGGLPYQAWAKDLAKQRTEQNGKDDPSSHCLPGGLVKLHTNPFRRQIIQTPGLLVMLFERDATFRLIYTDGRPVPAEVDLPSFNGFSSGTWDGDTLVVETVGFKQGDTEKDGAWLDRNGNPLTGAARITERFHRVDFGNLEVTLTVNDPKAYTAPWTVKLNQVRSKSDDLIEYICAENERDAARLVGK
jgi:hypothetical protein